MSRRTARGVVVRQYGKGGPWHLVRADRFTVCGKSADAARHQQSATLSDDGMLFGTVSNNRLCANCDRMKDADSVRLAK